MGKKRRGPVHSVYTQVKITMANCRETGLKHTVSVHEKTIVLKANDHTKQSGNSYKINTP